MYTGTIFNWHDNSGFEVGTDVVDTTNRPLFMVVNSFDKGPEKLMEVDATTFNTLFGNMSYERHGQASIQAQKIARLNRSKIRQTSGAVPSSRAGNAADIKLPVRPEGLRISDHSFISTDVVRLPSPGGLAKPLSQSERQNLQQQNEKSAVSQSPKPAPQGNKENTPTFDKPKFLSPANATQVAKVRPLPNKQSASSSSQTTLRPNAKFIDPKDI